MLARRMGPSSRRRGVALLYAVFGAFMAGAMVTVMMTMSGVTHRRSELERAQTQAQYAAEGALEAAKKVVQESIANWKEPPAQGEVQIAGRTVGYTIESTGPSTILTDPSGIQTIVDGFELRSTATVDRAQATANRMILAESTPVFQFAVFYSDDLEILPGPSMTLGGRVHSNGSMHLGSGNTLTLDTNYVRAVGKILRRRKDTTDSEGTVTIRRWVENPFDGSEPEQYVRMDSRSQTASQGVTTPSGYDSDFTAGYDRDGDGVFGADDWLPFAPGALEKWGAPAGYGEEGYTLLTGAHGVQEAVSPSIGSIKMFEEHAGGDWIWNATTQAYEQVAPGSGTHAKGYYHQNAGLSIIVAADGESWTAYDGDGTDVSFLLRRAVELTSLYDARQGGYVPVVEVDMDRLARSGKFPGNGLVYASHVGLGQGTDAKGVLLTNGEELAAKLTVVSDGALYVHGDYNTVDKKGSAVIADAINLLSNSWDGSKSAGGGLPHASNTTYNVAMMTGNRQTVGSSYNGGLENLPRFHENWSGDACRINGSFVNVWESEQATGSWSYGGNRYTAPARLWGYDPMFNQVANLPPFTPMVVSARDVVSW